MAFGPKEHTTKGFCAILSPRVRVGVCKDLKTGLQGSLLGIV